MAPEQILGQRVSFATDVWAFGVVLYELLTGRRPFDSDSIDGLWIAIANATPDYELLAGSGAPAAVQAIVRRCLEKRLEQRYPGFEPICRDIEAVLDAAPTTATAALPASRLAEARKLWEQSAKPFRYGAIAGIGVLAAGIIVLASLLGRPSHEIKLPSGDMVLVPGGPASIGPDGHLHKVNVPAFYIDKTEVSNRAYAEFSASNGISAAQGLSKRQTRLPGRKRLLLRCARVCKMGRQAAADRRGMGESGAGLARALIPLGKPAG
jgi:serine/threonine-protein kinase